MPAVTPDGEIAIDAGMERDHPAARRLDGEPEWNDEGGAVAAVAIREAEAEVRVSRDRGAAPGPPCERTERDCGLPWIDIAHEQPGTRRDRERSVTPLPARVEAAAPVKSVTRAR